MQLQFEEVRIIIGPIQLKKEDMGKQNFFFKKILRFLKVSFFITDKTVSRNSKTNLIFLETIQNLDQNYKPYPVF